MNSPEWIRATLLLAQGERAEAAHWLAAHLQTHPEDADLPEVMWLHAQTHSDRDRRVNALRRLTRMHDGNNPYVALARETLAIEERYAAPAPSRWRGRAAVAGLGGVAVLAIGWGAVNLFAPASEAVTATPTPDEVVSVASPTPAPTATLPPSMAQRVDLAPARYGAGVLRVVAIEDGARAIVNPVSGLLVSPITGAQFYTVRLAFECRAGICDSPPQATVQLVQSDGFVFDPKPDVRASDDPGFPPVALGIISEGVLVFEVPVIGVPARLLITPLNEAERPLALDLRMGGQ